MDRKIEICVSWSICTFILLYCFQHIMRIVLKTSWANSDLKVETASVSIIMLTY